MRDRQDPVLEGGLARRNHLIEALGPRAEVHQLPAAPGRSPPGRALVLARALVQGLLDSRATRADVVLVPFPDVPGLSPATPVKLALVLAWLAALRRALSRRGKRLWVDVGDVPRWQHPTLRLPMTLRASLWRMLERALLGWADVVTVSTPSLGSWLASDLGLPSSRFVVLENGAPAWVLTVPRPPRPAGGPCRFIVAGCLDPSQDRGVPGLCEAFIRSGAASDAELLLIGEGGQELAAQFRAPGLVIEDARPESDLVPRLLACDFGLIPYPVGGYYRTVCPTKLALYALARLPVLSSPLDEVGPVVARHGLGECLDPVTVFERRYELRERYRPFTGGRDLERLTWEWQANSFVTAHVDGEE